MLETCICIYDKVWTRPNKHLKVTAGALAEAAVGWAVSGSNTRNPASQVRLAACSQDCLLVPGTY